jgi:hypothetical protein
MRRLIALAAAAALVPTLAARAERPAPASPSLLAAAADPPEPAGEDKTEELEKRVQKLEREAALDRVQFSGDFRFEAHSIDATVPDYYDGLKLQSQVVNTLFFVNGAGRFPSGIPEVESFIRSHYADYLYFTQNLTFDQLRQAMAQFPPEAQQQLYSLLLPSTFVAAAPADNRILYTNRLRLRLESQVAKDVTFSGRLGMYKVWGDSTGVQVLNGQPTSVNVDGTTVGVPNSDILRVERAYFSWNKVGGTPLYISIGRRPSTEGAPLTLRNDEPRGGTPLGALINYQFDGITLGYGFKEGKSTLRLCYGLGYESGFGNGDVLKLPQDRLKDAHFLGANWDVWDDERTFVQLTVARAFGVTDGFNGLVVLPNNPVTGQPIGAPIVMRYTPSANLGDLDLASIVVLRKQGPLDAFASFSLNQSHPDPVTTPFGGFFSDPFEAPEERTGTMWYLGLRYRFNEDKTKLGAEFNHGSQYWLNFAVAEDDIIAPKTSARGDVFEAYLTHRIRPKLIAKLSYIKYWYDYSLSGWQVGAPKQLDSTPAPILGLPTYDSAGKVAFALIARF